ncbi:Rpn family recombination-promoting nuclease/putative transposase [Allopusillimonas ginsengisoli]|uniref:Rpn family recombination-promoting nuclease/putative transposase n=1 Tax=Allopusillimonas ginsengisoli TaxID=453575 RepID=UPI00102286EB|nr:Rpn family recombination-promoting nuclease/putative transposase [Allopusillimonas ginsengisoli]TEA79923.1 Rpn family recombination-promoting nuclease/putative transposase [Allopusillimonas ginsengisoli]
MPSAFPTPVADIPKEPAPRLSLCNDVVFKTLFANHLPLLTDLINAVLYPASPIVVQRVLNPHILPADLTGKNVVLDILAEDAQGQRVGVEMQLRRYLHWPQRNIYGVARTLAGQLQAGQDYQQLKPAIGISLLVHDLFDKHPYQASWRFTLRDQKRPRVQLDPALQVHIIELRKAERLRKLPAPLRAWIACLLHNLNEAAMNAITYPPVKEALKCLETMCSDEELRLAAERREQALVDVKDMIDCALHDGERIGLQKGMRQTLLSQLARKFGHLPQPFKARLEHADVQQLHAWSLNLLDAKRIEDIFA